MTPTVRGRWRRCPRDLKAFGECFNTDGYNHVRGLLGPYLDTTIGILLFTD